MTEKIRCDSFKEFVLGWRHHKCASRRMVFQNPRVPEDWHKVKVFCSGCGKTWTVSRKVFQAGIIRLPYNGAQSACLPNDIEP